MPQLALNKTSLTRETKLLGTYERFLPSLDLKRKQLMAERNKARRSLAATRERINDIEDTIGAEIPMAADRRMNLSGLMRVSDVSIAEENLVGLKLPVLTDVIVEHVEYSFMARPTWVDMLVEKLDGLMRLYIEAQVDEQRLAVLEEAVKKITQRVNLFDKVLIPRTRDNIRRIQIKLSDAERAAVVNAKIAKRKRQAA